MMFNIDIKMILLKWRVKLMYLSKLANSLILIITSLATTTISTICGNYFTQHIPLHIPRRSQNKPKPIPDYLPD